MQVEPNDPTEAGEQETELSEEQRAQAERDATQGDQGPQVQEQAATDISPGATGGFDPDAPSRISPPAPDAQSGTPDIPENREGGDRDRIISSAPEGGTSGDVNSPEGDDEGDGDQS